MSKSTNMPEETNYLQKIVSLAVIDENFRNELTLNPEEAINNASDNLGFAYDKIPQTSLEVLDSFTAEELDTLHRMYSRAKKVGIDLEPKYMF